MVVGAPCGLYCPEVSLGLAVQHHSHLSCLQNVAKNQTSSLKSAQTRGLFHAAGLADGARSHRDNPQAKSFGRCRGSPVLVRRARFKLMIFKAMQEARGIELSGFQVGPLG